MGIGNVMDDAPGSVVCRALAVACCVSRHWQSYPRRHALALPADMARDMRRWSVRQEGDYGCPPFACRSVQNGDSVAQLGDGED